MAEMGEGFWKILFSRIPTEGLVIFGFSWLCLEYLKELHKVKSPLCFTVEVVLFGLIISGLIITIATIFRSNKPIEKPGARKSITKLVKTQ
jgi:hypothetical protein